MYHKKFGPDRFSRFDVYWIQTNRQTDRQAKFIYRWNTLYRFLCFCSILYSETLCSFDVIVVYCNGTPCSFDVIVVYCNGTPCSFDVIVVYCIMEGPVGWMLLWYILFCGTPCSFDVTPCMFDFTPCMFDFTPCMFDVTPCSFDVTPYMFDAICDGL